VDDERKKDRDFLDELKEEIRRPVTEFETREKERVQYYQNSVEFLNLLRGANDPMFGSVSSTELTQRYDWLDSISIDESWKEFEAEGLRAKTEGCKILVEAIKTASKREFEQAELERFRKEKEIQDQKDREERIAKEAAEKAKAQAEETAEKERDRLEREKIIAEEKVKQAERDKIMAEERAKVEQERAVKEAEARVKAEAEKKEQDRLAKEAAEKQAEEKKQAEARKLAESQNHRALINRKIVAVFVETGFTDEQAKRIVTMLAKNAVPHVTVNY